MFNPLTLIRGPDLLLLPYFKCNFIVLFVTCLRAVTVAFKYSIKLVILNKFRSSYMGRKFEISEKIMTF